MNKIRKNWLHEIHLMEDEISREAHSYRLREALQTLNIPEDAEVCLWGDQGKDISQAKELLTEMPNMTFDGRIINSEIPEESKPSHIDTIPVSVQPEISQ